MVYGLPRIDIRDESDQPFLDGSAVVQANLNVN